MTLTFTSVSIYRTGPGHIVECTTTIGPAPIDDYLEVIVNHGLTGRFLVGGNTICRGALSVTVRLGIYEHLPAPYPTNWTGSLDHAVLSVTGNWRHANNALVETVSDSANFHWDASSGLWTLLGTVGIGGLTRYFPPNS